MAHELDFSTGKAGMAYVGETPWHGLGSQLEQGASLDTWRENAGLNWHVRRAAVEYNAAGPDAETNDMHVFGDSQVLFRNDTRAPLGIVSPHYKIVQPEDVMEFFRDITEAGGFDMETAGSLMGGKKIWALARVGEGASIIGHDVVRPYLLLATSFDGSLATVAKFTSVRVVCNNTLTMAVPGTAEKDAPVVSQVKVMHRNVFDADAVKAQLGIVNNAWANFLIDARILAHKELSQKQAEELTRELFPSMSIATDKREAKESRGFRQVMALFDGGAKGSALTEGKTGWQWLNSVTEFVDWQRGHNADTRMTSAWFGMGEDVKSRALDLALHV